ncbi:unnamed protein product [Lepidochelys olivacea]
MVQRPQLTEHGPSSLPAQEAQGSMKGNSCASPTSQPSDWNKMAPKTHLGRIPGVKQIGPRWGNWTHTVSSAVTSARVLSSHNHLEQVVVGKGAMGDRRAESV